MLNVMWTLSHAVYRRHEVRSSPNEQQQNIAVCMIGVGALRACPHAAAVRIAQINSWYSPVYHKAFPDAEAPMRFNAADYAHVAVQMARDAGALSQTTR